MKQKRIAAILLIIALGTANIFSTAVYADSNLTGNSAVNSEFETETVEEDGEDVPEENVGSSNDLLEEEGDAQEAGVDQTETTGEPNVRAYNAQVESASSALAEGQDGPDWEDTQAEKKTTYYKGQYYATLVDALTAVYTDTDTKGTKEIHCKPEADVGHMTHGHVADDLTIYGNDAYVSGGERDLEIDTYKYNRATGEKLTESESDLEKDITVTVIGLDGIAAWGFRRTEYNINLNFKDCQNMQRILFTNNGEEVGDININVDGCSFDGEDENLAAYQYSSISSIFNGTIKVNNTVFKNIDMALNLYHVLEGTQTVTITDSQFINCGQGLSKDDQEKIKTYAAPVRIVAQEGATSNLTVENSEFIYDGGISNCGNGDVLLGAPYGTDKTGTTTLEMTDTQAHVMVQKVGYFNTENGTTDPDKTESTFVKKTDVVTPSVDNHFEVNKHDHNFGNWTSNGNGTHTGTCLEPGCTETQTANCSGGSSSCQSRATCSVCGGKYGPYGNHSYGDWKSDAKNHWKVCWCGATTAKAEHSFGEWVVTKEATKAEDGSRERSCSVCEYKETEVIPALGFEPGDPEHPDRPGKMEITNAFTHKKGVRVEGVSENADGYEFSIRKGGDGQDYGEIYDVKEGKYTFKDLEEDTRYVIRIRPYHLTDGVKIYGEKCFLTGRVLVKKADFTERPTVAEVTDAFTHKNGIRVDVKSSGAHGYEFYIRKGGENQEYTLVQDSEKAYCKMLELTEGQRYVIRIKPYAIVDEEKVYAIENTYVTGRAEKAKKSLM